MGDPAPGPVRGPPAHLLGGQTGAGDADRQRQTSAELDDVARRLGLGRDPALASHTAQEGHGGLPGEDAERKVADGLQPAEPGPAGDDRGARRCAGQERADLGLVEGVVEDDEDAAAGKAGAVQGQARLQLLGDGAAVHAEDPQEAGEDAGRGQRRAPGAPEIDEELPVREALPEEMGDVDGQRALAGARGPGDRDDGRGGGAVREKQPAHEVDLCGAAGEVRDRPGQQSRRDLSGRLRRARSRPRRRDEDLSVTGLQLERGGQELDGGRAGRPAVAPLERADGFDTQSRSLRETLLGLAGAASTGLPVHFSPGAIGETRGWEPVLEMAGALLTDRIGWFEAERQALVAAIGQATEHGLDGLALHLAAATTGFLELRGYVAAWREVHDSVIQSARRTGNRRAEADLLWSLGELHIRQDWYDLAVPCYRHASGVFSVIGDRLGEARCLRATGYLCRMLSRYSESLSCYERAHAIANELGERSLEAYALHGIGSVHLDRGDYEAAEACFAQGLESARELGEPRSEARALRGLAMVDRARGELDAAVVRVRRALEILRRDKDRRFEAHALVDLAELYQLGPRPDRARALYARCRQTFEEVADAFGSATVLRDTGRLLASRGKHAPAIAAGEEAVRIFRERGLRLWEARALRSLAHTLDAAGEGERASAAHRTARRLLDEIGIDAAGDRLGAP